MLYIEGEAITNFNFYFEFKISKENVKVEVETVREAIRPSISSGKEASRGGLQREEEEINREHVHHQEVQRGDAITDHAHFTSKILSCGRCTK